MLYGGGLLGLIELGLVVYCVLNVVTTPEDQIRHLPKLGWLLLVIVLPLAGGIAWLVAGRPAGPARSRSNSHPGNPANTPSAPARASNPDDDAAFMASLRLRAEQQRQAAAEQARKLRHREDGAT